MLVPRTIPSLWQIGKHQNNYEALVQSKPVKVWRDNNKDDVINYNNITTLVTRLHGINSPKQSYAESYVVNSGPGCQVFRG